MNFKKTHRWLCLLATHCLVAGAVAQKAGTIKFATAAARPICCGCPKAAEPDYQKYLGYAGLEIDVTTEKHYGTLGLPKRLRRVIWSGRYSGVGVGGSSRLN